MRWLVLLMGLGMLWSGAFGVLRAEEKPKSREQERREKKQREEKKKREEEQKKKQRNNRAPAAPEKNKPARPKRVIIKDSDARRPEGEIHCLEREFTFETQIETEPEVKLTCLIPADSSGKPTAGAHDMVFYSPYVGARQALAKRTELRRYARALGMTIFTIEITTDSKYVSDPEKYYCLEASGWHEVVIAAWGKVREEFQLDKRKLLIVGDSAGGSYAQQIAARYPDEIDAVAFTGGRLYANIRENRVNWLTMSTWECPGMLGTRELARQYRELGVNILQSEAPPVMPDNPMQPFFHHAPSRIAFELMEDYLAGIRDLRTQNGGAVPPPADWPARETIFGREHVFPSKATAENWMRLPHAMRREVSMHDKLPIVLEPPVITAETPVVIYAHDAEINNTTLEDNFCFLAQQKYICIGLNPGATVNDYQALGRYIQKHDPQRKVYAIGAYGSGERMAVGLLGELLKIERMTLLNTDLESLIAAFNAGRAQNRRNTPIDILQDTPLEDAPKNRHHIEARTYNRHREFGAGWFQALAEGLGD